MRTDSESVAQAGNPWFVDSESKSNKRRLKIWQFPVSYHCPAIGVCPALAKGGSSWRVDHCGCILPYYNDTSLRIAAASTATRHNQNSLGRRQLHQAFGRF